MSDVSEQQQKIKRRSFTYRTSSAWVEGRSGFLTSEGKPTLRISSPPEFKGEQGVWSPEDLFVASVEMCHMATFMGYAAKENVPVISYRSHANGVLEYVDGDYRFTRIVIFPTVIIPANTFEKNVQQLFQEAQRHCQVANSIGCHH